MRPRISSAALVAVLLGPGVAGAGRLNTTYLVPAYEGCPRGTTTTTQASPAPCTPARRESTFTFESAVLKTAPARYIAANKVAFMLVIRGIRDGSGALVTTRAGDPTDDFQVVSPPGQTTLTFLSSTYAPGAISGPVVIPFDVKDGAAKVIYKTPGTILIPDGIVVEGGSVVVLDNQGKRLATIGAQSPPVR